jgi:hypothetical protein
MFGRRGAMKNASEKGPAPRNVAVSISRKKPSTRLIRV